MKHFLVSNKGKKEHEKFKKGLGMKGVPITIWGSLKYYISIFLCIFCIPPPPPTPFRLRKILCPFCASTLQLLRRQLLRNCAYTLLYSMIFRIQIQDIRSGMMCKLCLQFAQGRKGCCASFLVNHHKFSFCFPQ